MCCESQDNTEEGMGRENRNDKTLLGQTKSSWNEQADEAL